MSRLKISYFCEATILLFEAVITNGKVIEQNYGKRLLFVAVMYRSSMWSAWLAEDHS